MNAVWNIRRFATQTALLGPQSAKLTIQKFLNSEPTTLSLRSALLACSKLEAAYKASSKADYSELSQQHDVEEARMCLKQVLQKYEENPTIKITDQTLLEYFTYTCQPSTKSALQVLGKFALKCSCNVVPEQIAMIPFRRAVYEADFGGALDVMKLTCGVKSNYKYTMSRRLKKIGGIWALGMGSTLLGAYSSLNSGILGQWDTGTSLMMCLMFGTYLFAVTVFGMLTIFGSKSGLGSVLEWIPGTSPLYRFKHREQVKMATFVAELNRSLPENLGDCSPLLLKDLQDIYLRPVETQSEAHLKEFWARAGAGFDWIEPDQDPAHLLWTKNMESSRLKRVGSSYSRKDSEGKLLSWISEVEKEKQGKSFPHASLLGVQELRSEQGMLGFEEELERDMKNIRAAKRREQIGDSSAKGK